MKISRLPVLAVSVLCLIRPAVGRAAPAPAEGAAPPPPLYPDVESVRAKAAEFDQRIEQLRAEMESLKPVMEQLEITVREKVGVLKALLNEPARIGAETRRRADILRAGDEKAQLQALKGFADLGDEGLLLAARAVEVSKHRSVRRFVLNEALEMGEDGYGVVGLCFEKLPSDDRVYVAKRLAARPDDNTLPLLLAMARAKDPELRKAIVAAGAPLGHAPLIVAAAAKEITPETVDAFIEAVAGIEGEDGDLLLYAAAAKAQPAERVKAVEAAARRGESGLVAVGAAWKSEDPAVRAEVVRAARQIGGPVAETLIDRARRDPNPLLREAAEAALAVPEEAPAAE